MSCREAFAALFVFVCMHTIQSADDTITFPRASKPLEQLFFKSHRPRLLSPRSTANWVCDLYTQDKVRLCVKILELLKSTSLTPLPVEIVRENAMNCLRREIVLNSNKPLTGDVFQCSMDFALENLDYPSEEISPQSTIFYITNGINAETVFLLHDVIENPIPNQPTALEQNEPARVNSQDGVTDEKWTQEDFRSPFREFSDDASVEYKPAGSVNDLRIKELYVSTLLKLNWFRDYKVIDISKKTLEELKPQS